MDNVQFLQGCGGWIWMVKGKNGQTLAVSGRAYSKARDARRGFRTLLETLAPIVKALEDARNR